MQREATATGPAPLHPHPRSILDREDLSRDAKIRILKEWEHDALERDVATAEGMAGGPRTRLQAITDALRTLEEETSDNQDRPLRQGRPSRGRRLLMGVLFLLAIALVAFIGASVGAPWLAPAILFAATIAIVLAKSPASWHP